MIEIKTINSIGDLIDFAFTEGKRDLTYRKRINYTFRGQRSTKYELKSSLKRNSGNKYEYVEIRLLNNFRKYGQIIDPKVCDSIWKNMIISQHHGIPTRLLDFSLSPLVALHFATCDAYTGDNEDAVVWAVNHGMLHKLLPENSTRAGALTSNNINASAMTPLRWEIELPPKERNYPPPAEAGVIAALI